MGNAVIEYILPDTLLYFSTSMLIRIRACLLELSRGNKHTYRHCPHHFTPNHDLMDTNIIGQKGVRQFVLCPSRNVSRRLPAARLVLIKP